MGFDVSYHPISEKEIDEWYFKVLEAPQQISILGDEYKIDPFYIQKYSDTISVANNADSNSLFDTSHGYFIAVVHGFFRTYYYTRGSAFSFLIEENATFGKYTTPWANFVPAKFTNPQDNFIKQNYSSGVFLSADQVKELLADYNSDAEIRSALDTFYSDGRINVFLKALGFASENKLGILEATEVIEPNPIDLNKSGCYSNLFNCDTEGPSLYREAALEQFREIEKSNNLPEGTLQNKAVQQIINVETPTTQEEPPKKSFWKRLFG